MRKTLTDLHAHSLDSDTDPDIAISVPASSAYLSVVRTAAAGLAARLDFTIDEIEDLRIAADEACTILLAHGRPGSTLDCRFDQVGDSVVVTGSIASDIPDVPDRDGFSWTVLTALSTDVQMGVRSGDGGDHRLVITLTQTGDPVRPQ